MAIGTVPAATLIFAGIIGFSAGNQAWSEGRLHRGWLAAGPAESVTDAVTVLGASPHIPKGATAHGAHKLLFSSLPRSCCSSFCFDVTYEVAKRRRNTAISSVVNMQALNNRAARAQKPYPSGDEIGLPGL